MKKNIGYGAIFSLIVLSGCFFFYIYYQETYIRLDKSRIEVKVDNEYWTSNDVTVTVKYNDANMKPKSYSFDGGKTWQSSNEYIATENQVLDIVLKASNGKKTSPLLYRIENIDKSKPIIDAEDIIYVEVNKIIDLDSYYTVTDSLSGLKGNVKVSSEALDMTTIGTYSVEIYALDHALNSINKIVTIEVVAANDPRLVKQNPNQFVSVTGLTINKTRISLVKGTSVNLSATIKPGNATNKKITWSSNNPAVAAVDVTGKVLAISAGSTTITATTEDGNKSSDIKVVVTNEKIEVAKIELDRVVDIFTTDSSKITLVATITPEDATDQNIIWSSSNTNVATVTNGIVTIKNEGVTTITATTSNGKIATYRLTIKDNYTFQEKTLLDNNNQLKGYSIIIYKNGTDITKNVSNIMSPFSATNDKKASIDINMTNHNQLKNSLTFMYNNNKYTAYR